MSTKRALLVILVASGVMLAARGGAVRALPWGPVADESGRAPAGPSALAALPVTDQIQVSSDTGNDPAVAYNSVHDEYLVVWGTPYEVRAQRVSGRGELLGSEFYVAQGSNEQEADPAVAYSPVQDKYLIVYAYEVDANNWDLRAKRVSWSGDSTSTEFVINNDSGCQWNPAVAYNSGDDEYLVVYENLWPGGLQDIAAQRVKASDGSLPHWVNVATGAGEDREVPDVAYSAARDRYLIAYTYEAWAGGDCHIYGKVAAADLAGVGSSDEIHICADSNDQGFVAVAAGPDEYMAVWQQGMGPSGGIDVFARRLDGGGTPQGGGSGFEIAGSGTTNYRGAAAEAYGAGCGYLVAWMHEITGDISHVYGRYVMEGQDSAAGDLFAVVDTPHAQNMPAAACAPSGDCLVVYEDVSTPGGGTDDWEIRGRFVRPRRSIYLPLVVRDPV